MNRYELRARVYFFIGMLNLILAVPLGIKWGGIGCAVATGSAMLIGEWDSYELDLQHED